MPATEKLDRYDGVLLGGLILVFMGLSKYFFWFTLDDSYITLRYSKHLASGATLVWNIGADPVEGYTSFLWVLIGAIPHTIGLPAIPFVKVVGMISTILAFVLLYRHGRQYGVNRLLLVAGCAQLAVSPAVAVLSVQGMETTTAMLLTLIASIAALKLVRAYQRRWAVVMNVTLFLGMLARPDLVIFAILLEAGLAGLLYCRGRLSEIPNLVGWGFVLAFIPGVVYMTARFLYFGYLLPNPFYVKTGGSILSISGATTTFEFVMLLVGPFLFLALFGAIMSGNSDRVLEISPVFVASAGYLSLWLFIKPWQGFLWRFQSPVLAAMLLITLLVLDQVQRRQIEQRVATRGSVTVVVSLLLISGLVVYPLFTFPTASANISEKTPGDRIVMGKALDSVNGENYRMFVTESGATPYYSEWDAIDEWGLNSERIAHNGLTESYLREYDPDLIQILVKGRPGMIKRKSSPTAAFVEDSSYRLVAVVHRQNRDGTNVAPDKYHLYFVDTESEGYRDIACTLLTQDLTYGNLSVITAQSNVNVQTSNLTAAGCSG